MKNRCTLLTLASLFALGVILPSHALAARLKSGKASHPPPPSADETVVGSIRPKGKLTATQRAALAKISFEQAKQIASAEVSGQTIYGELVVANGNLQYDFQIIGSDKKVTEVAIDAGNGTVLATFPVEDA